MNERTPRGFFYRPRRDAPLPGWVIFPLIFTALYASHASLLRLPYYWDEAGYYIPAAWDFFRTGSLIPITTLSNAHPPLPSVYLALWWKVAGFTPAVTREVVLLVASLGLVAVWRLALRISGTAAVAFWTLVLTALYPIWFAQSTLAHADIFAAACTLWGLVYALPESGREPGKAAVWFMAAALCKETSIAVPLTLAAMSLVDALRARSAERWPRLREAAWLAACVMPLAGWYAWHYARTGYLFGNPEFLRYNAETTVAPVRILAAFVHRVLHLTGHMNLFVPVLMGMAALTLAPRKDAQGRERAALSRVTVRRIYGVLAVNALFFSALGGALLTRYLLPMYPLVLLLAVWAMWRRIPYWQGVAAFSAAAFVAALFINPPYGFAPEDNLQYARVIRMEQAGIAQLETRYPEAVVLSAWPVTDALTRPELGYVKNPFEVFALEDFTAEQIARAAAEPGRYSAALVFSTKYDPQPSWFTLGAKSKELDERYFGLHHDLPPELIAAQLGGDLVWRENRDGMWVALIRFHRQFEARMAPLGEY